jgi:hypothetical protein
MNWFKRDQSAEERQMQVIERSRIYGRLSEISSITHPTLEKREHLIEQLCVMAMQQRGVESLNEMSAKLIKDFVEQVLPLDKELLTEKAELIVKLNKQREGL